MRSTRLFHLSCNIKATFTLKKHERLKSRKLLEQLFRQGSTLFIHPIKIYYSFKEIPEGITLQAGFGASSRTFKKAVERNRIKRLLREAYRLQKNSIQEKLETSGKQLAIFFLYTGKEVPGLDAIKEKMELLLQNLEKMVK